VRKPDRAFDRRKNFSIKKWLIGLNRDLSGILNNLDGSQYDDAIRNHSRREEVSF